MNKSILNAAQNYERDMVKFLRDMISIPSESCNEEKVVLRIKEEMEKTGFDEIVIDGMGNILGRIGSGKKIIAMDAHIDTVGVGNIEQWNHDPYDGKFENGTVYGLGASDQEGGMASMVYGGKLIKDLKLESDYTLYVVGSVQEEDCDGLCWQYIVNEEKLRPDCVVITEPTGLNVYRGQRGRMEITASVAGRSAHGSAPERGINAVYLMSRMVLEIEKLNLRLKEDAFLGKGSITVSQIISKSPSLCAVPSSSSIHIDRSLTAGEDMESALAEIEDAAVRAGVEADIKIPEYSKPSYKGKVYPAKAYFPTWILDENHPLLAAASAARSDIMGSGGEIGKWTFSTNGVATMGMLGIPTVGFGPGEEKYAHTVDDQVPAGHLVKAAAFYAAFPGHYLRVVDGA